MYRLRQQANNARLSLVHSDIFSSSVAVSYLTSERKMIKNLVFLIFAVCAVKNGLDEGERKLLEQGLVAPNLMSVRQLLSQLMMVHDHSEFFVSNRCNWT